MSNIAYVVKVSNSSYNACDKHGQFICGANVSGEYCSSSVNGDSFTICVKDHGSQCFFTYDDRGTLISDYSLPLDEPSKPNIAKNNQQNISNNQNTSDNQQNISNNNNQNTSDSNDDNKRPKEYNSEIVNRINDKNQKVVGVIYNSNIDVRPLAIVPGFQFISKPFHLLNLCFINIFICALYSVPDPFSVLTFGMLIWTLLWFGHIYSIKCLNLYNKRRILYLLTSVFFITSMIIRGIRF